MASASRKQAVPQALAGVDTEQALLAFRDPCWRLERLYSIRTRDGSVIRFAPRAQQAQIIDLIYRQGCRRIIILKARQLGMSTLLGVICANRLCFGLGQQISLIDQTIEDARQKLRDIVLVAYDSLDPALKRELPITRSNTGELAVKFVRHEEVRTNAMFAGTHARGGANSFLCVSEWVVIQATNLARSEEVLTGALPSVGDGVCVVETTWRGGIDIIVNNAGIMQQGLVSVADTDDALFDRLFAINVKGTFNTLRLAAKRLRQGGRIVNFSTSVVGLGLPGYAPYAATKSAVETLTNIFAKELRGREIS